MMYADVVAEFAWRTKQNLRHIENAKRSGEQVFETTQLINSMLGLLVFPREDYLKNVPHTSLSELRSQGWPIPSASPGFDEAPHLADLVRCMRNGISHFNLEFYADSQNQITGMRMWNLDRYDNETWKADFTLEELHGVADRFSQLLVDLSNFRPAA